MENAEIVNFTPALETHHLDVDIDGTEVDDILINIDILTAIRYYGVTELLDTIGEERLRSHLECL